MFTFISLMRPEQNGVECQKKPLLYGAKHLNAVCAQNQMNLIQTEGMLLLKFLFENR